MATSCEKNILDAAEVTPTLPDSDDLVLFTLPDGTSVFRAWSTINAGLVPPDEEIVVTASGGIINHGDSAKVFSGLIGRRIRLFRNRMKESTINQGGSYYSFNAVTGQVSWVPAATTLELFQIECY
jgi:hypothetical protein